MLPETLNGLSPEPVPSGNHIMVGDKGALSTRGEALHPASRGIALRSSPFATHP
jgi:hypothetical protein